jgi:hypothetical protein
MSTRTSRTRAWTSESARLRNDGWTVQTVGDQLICSRKKSEKSALEHGLIAALILGGLTYGAIAAAGAERASSLPASHVQMAAIAAVVGFVLAWRAAKSGGGRDERMTVSIDRYNRPVFLNQGARAL